MRQHPLRNMLVVMGLALVLLVVTILAGRSPTLGLDLQGGISVNLQPFANGEPLEEVSAEQLDEAIAIIRKRVDATGVAEPEISRQGDTVTVQTPKGKREYEVTEVEWLEVPPLEEIPS